MIQAGSRIQFPTPVTQYYSNKYHSNTKPTAIINQFYNYDSNQLISRTVMYTG